MSASDASTKNAGWRFVDTIRTSIVLAVASLLFISCAPAPDTQDYRAATWALSIGGHVQISTESGAIVVQALDNLPREPFRLTTISWDIYPGDRNTQVTDSSLSHVAGLAELRELDLWAADVGDEGLKHLAELPELSRLQLSETRVTDNGLKHFANLKNLRQLFLYDTQITPNGIQRLKRMLPKCEIHFRKKKSPSKGSPNG